MTLMEILAERKKAQAQAINYELTEQSEPRELVYFPMLAGEIIEDQYSPYF